LVGCSAGADSVALALILSRLKKRLGFEMALSYVHHGPSGESRTERARARAAVFVKKLAARLEIDFFAESPSRSELRSEEELRAFRHASLERLRQVNGFDMIALAHHADDLFETRLIRLIRGTGPQGLKAMSFVEGCVLRPLLVESRANLIAYLEERGQKWLEDPTNRSEEPLRNWVRRRWLRDLEQRRPGAGRAFARSLELLVQEQEQNAVDYASYLSENRSAIRRDLYLRLGHAERRRLLAGYLRERGVKNFSKKHIDEIAKRLDSPRKVFTFNLLRSRWDINAERILVFASATHKDS
jgi:tRNA(Ile)-lysidine synthase